MSRRRTTRALGDTSRLSSQTVLFALTDFALYLARRGPYNDGAIRGLGGVRADPAEAVVPTVSNSVSTFFLHPVRSPISWVIMYLTSSPWSHTGIVFPDGVAFDATVSGVRQHPIADYLDGRGYIGFATAHSIPAENQEAARSFFQATVGDGYNWRGAQRLGLSIVLGSHRHWRPRIFADVGLTLLGFAALANWHGPCAMIALVAFYTYVVILGTNMWWMFSRKVVAEPRDVTPAMQWTAALRATEARKRFPDENRVT